MRSTFFFIAQVLMLVFLLVGVKTSEAQTVVRAYSPWAAGSWDSGSWQVLGRQGNVVAMLPQGYYGRWANVPVRGVYEVQRPQTGETVWVTEDSAGNRQIYREDPIANARAEAISLEAQAEYQAELAEVERYRTETELAYRKKSSRLDNRDERALNTDRHQGAMDQVRREVDDELVSRRAQAVLGRQRNQEALLEASPLTPRASAPTPQSVTPAAAATDSGSTQNPLALAAMEAHRAYFQLYTDNQQLKNQTRDLFWERADAWVKEASNLQTKAGHTEAVRRLEQLIDRVDDELQDLGWPEQRDKLIVERLSLP